MKTTNTIDSSAFIHPDIKLGKYNQIGKNVEIKFFSEKERSTVSIGDNNIISDNTRILVGPEGLVIGDWNVFHNDMLVLCGKRMEIGHNCWFGQNTVLDASGELTIGNGVRVGMFSQVWTHVASGEQIEGCLLYGARKTVIEDDVWLVGSCTVGSGLTLGKKSICLAHSVVTKDTEAGKSYAGSPAKLLEKAQFWKPVTLTEKFEMLLGWIKGFAANNVAELTVATPGIHHIELTNTKNGEKLIFRDTTDRITDAMITEFNLADKTFIKKNTTLERAFYKFINNNKARFIPRGI